LAPNKDKRNALYLTQVTSVRLDLPEVIAAIRSEIERDRPALVVLDERRAGIGVVQHLKRDGDRSTWLSNCNDTAPSAPSCALRLLVAASFTTCVRHWLTKRYTSIFLPGRGAPRLSH
jgi:hypothetical protein